ncbi:hypothetical protein ACH5RR_039117 [Cinchona calisaya]|uniref:Uncharacterized protein n=1 Tax=Cinchona calisaya TaxID=153742 RepID=A0ABD2XXD4_9GENT
MSVMRRGGSARTSHDGSCGDLQGSGVEFTLDSTYLNTLLQCPNKGSTFCTQKVWSPIADKSIVMQTYFPNYNVDDGVSNLTMESFSPTDRVLSHIITRILAPTKGHRTNVSNFSIHFLYVITRHVLVNYGAFMTGYMKLCQVIAGHSLCFPCTITHILKFHNVSQPLNPNLAICISQCDVIDKAAFIWLKLINRCNEWMYRKNVLRSEKALVVHDQIVLMMTLLNMLLVKV